MNVVTLTKNNFCRRLDRLDKAFLDQDSDEVSISDDELDDGSRGKHRQSLSKGQPHFGSGTAGGPLSPKHPDVLPHKEPNSIAHHLKALRGKSKRDRSTEESNNIYTRSREEEDDGDGEYDEVEMSDGMKGREAVDEALITRTELINSKKFPASSEVRLLPTKKGEKSRSRRVMKSSESSSSIKGEHLKMPTGEELAGAEEDDGDRTLDLSAVGVTKAALHNAREFRASLVDAKKSVGKEVRSYANATQTAQQMLASLPPPSITSKSCSVS
jgi:hypothetical protein